MFHISYMFQNYTVIFTAITLASNTKEMNN